MGEQDDGYLVVGYAYAATGVAAGLDTAPVGARVRLPAYEPPYLVVDHTLDNVRGTRWPGRLLRVGVPAPASDEEAAALERANENLRADASFRRALMVDVLEELSPAWLFGPRGERVVEVLDAALALDAETARRLADARRPGAETAFAAAWDRWVAAQPNGAPYVGRDHSRTLSVPGAGPSGSPVGHGLIAVWSTVRDSARRVAGEAAFETDEDGEQVLVPPWDDAAAALTEAAMALGAPDLFDTDPDADPDADDPDATRSPNKALAAWQAVLKS